MPARLERLGKADIGVGVDIGARRHSPNCLSDNERTMASFASHVKQVIGGHQSERDASMSSRFGLI